MTLADLSNLPSQELSRMVAERMGWREVFGKDRDNHYDRREWKKEGARTPEGWDGHYESDLPDYANDLNHMATAEATLTDEQYERFICDLWTLVAGDQPRQASCPIRFERAYLSATARQRAIAFLCLEP